MTTGEFAIDELYNDRNKVIQAFNSMEWENARVDRERIGYEDHGILTVSIAFRGECWGQSFGDRMLTNGNAFRLFVEGWLRVTGRDYLGSDGMVLRVGRAPRQDRIVAVRPLLESAPVFWPGNDPNRFYLFYGDGTPMQSPIK